MKYMVLQNIKKRIKEDLFKYVIILCLFLTFILLSVYEKNLFAPKLDENLKNVHKNELSVFVQDGCYHCGEAEKFLNSIKNDHKDINIKYYNLKNNNSVNFLFEIASIFNIPYTKLGTPMFVMNDNYLIGFNEEDKSRLLNLINSKEIIQNETINNELDLGIFGKYDLLKTSIPVLSIVMGLADGFNPCAMWVLIYLISVVAGLKDKRKMIFLVGAFVLSSGILYFLFMTAWLNIFIYVGYIRILSLAIGLFAIYFGTINIYNYIKSGGHVECKLGENQTRKDSMEKVKKLVYADLSLYSIFAIILLAFVVNSIEFLCSAALPATFTFILTQSNISTFMYYFYIFVYTLFFMLDDLIIFSLAVFAINKYVGSKYEKYSTIIGGSIMLIIGIFIVFFPNLLR